MRGRLAVPVCWQQMYMREDDMKETEIFVFGSNLAGRHGKGAALEAVKKHGAKYGVGVGPKGSSYAIPTKDRNLKTLPLTQIKGYVDAFLAWARGNPNLTFNVTRVGCGLAGYKDEDIAPFFRDAPANCKLDLLWERLLGRTLSVQYPEGDFFARDNVIRESYKPRPDERPNDYWERVSKEGSMLLSYDDLQAGLARKVAGYTRIMPISLAIPLVRFPRLLDMQVCVDTTSMKPDENVRFTWTVPDRDDERLVKPAIRVTRTDWAPDINEWLMLARFFHSNYAEAVRHEVDETFKFREDRVFDPHARTNDLHALDHHIRSLHNQATARRQKYHDLSR